jgi:tocopherol O-methyltransferase
MISVDGIRKESIRSHYQLGTLFYRLLWGPHIHHGLWHGDESPAVAQVQLTDTLAEMVGIDAGDEVVDVGCGMGGSSIRLAKEYGASVTGVTLSPVQARWAATSAFFKGARKRTRFMAQDAEKVQFVPETFDVLWSIECTEHLFDKPAFFKKAIDWLRPGGRLADYVSWIEPHGMEVIEQVDWTDRVARTWEICKQRVERTGVRHLAKWVDQEQVAFIDGFDALLNAYRTRAMQYGAIVARKKD